MAETMSRVWELTGWNKESREGSALRWRPTRFSWGRQASAALVTYTAFPPLKPGPEELGHSKWDIRQLGIFSAEPTALLISGGFGWLILFIGVGYKITL